MKANQLLQACGSASTPPQSQTNRPRRILVVDEDSDLRLLYSDLLARPGYSVDAAENGVAAWQALNTESYDLLITDNSMPNVTGIELLRKVRAARMALPVIMATGRLPGEDITRHPWFQPVATLLKPYTPAELLGTVKEALRATDGAHGQLEPLPEWRSQSSAGGFRP